MIFPVCTAGDAKVLDDILPTVALDVQHAIKGPDPSVDVKLFDTKNDPGETKNVAAENPDALREMKALARQTWPNAPRLQD
jgi:hypothetical protein